MLCIGVVVEKDLEIEVQQSHFVETQSSRSGTRSKVAFFLNHHSEPSTRLKLLRYVLFIYAEYECDNAPLCKKIAICLKWNKFCRATNFVSSETNFVSHQVRQIIILSQASRGRFWSFDQTRIRILPILANQYRILQNSGTHNDRFDHNGLVSIAGQKAG